MSGSGVPKDGNLAVPGAADQNSLTGTPMYLSPETVKGERRGKQGAMDVWAIGCVILECATGRRPWSNLDNEWAIMFTIGIASQHPPLPAKGELSDLGIEFLREALTIDPDDRPTAAELINHPWIQDARDQINAMTEEEEVARPAPSPSSSFRSRANSSLGSMASTPATTVLEEEEEEEEESVGYDQLESNSVAEVDEEEGDDGQGIVTPQQQTIREEDEYEDEGEATHMNE